MPETKTRKRQPLPQTESVPAAGYVTESVQTSAPLAGRYVEAFPLKGIVASKTNPRKLFDAEKLRELAESIKAKGVLEPLLVRPAKLVDFPAGDVVELVAGERRFRASLLAGVKTVPVRILQLSDQDALEVQVIENLQREDLDPVEEAEGFDQLLKAGRFNASGLAAKVHKSEAYVYGALKLLDLPEAARKALADGTINRSIAQLIGRIPSQKLREEAAEEIVGEMESGYGTISNYKDAKQYVERNFMVELKGAPFDQADATLTPAGPCTTCLARAGNSPHLYPGSRADVCTDTACFREKVNAHAQRREQEAREAGQAVIDNAEKLFSEYKPHNQAGHDVKYNAPWVDLDTKCHADDKGRTYRELLGDDAVAAAAVAVDPSGVAHDLVPTKLSDKILKEKKILTAGHRPNHVSQDDAKRLAEQKIRAEIGRRLQGEAVKAADAAGVSWMGAGPAFIRAMTAGVVEQFWSDARSRVSARRGEPVEKQVKGLTPRECLSLIVELVMARYAIAVSSLHHGGGDPPHVKELLAALKIDKSKIEKEVRAEAKAKKSKAKS